MFKKLSIIVPMYNCSKHIEPCLDSIYAQIDSVTEVILVDNNSTDDTVGKTVKYPFKLIHFKQGQSAALARNYGAKNSSGEVLLFIDADVVLREGALNKLCSIIDKEDVAVVSGVYSENTPENNFYSQFQNLLLIYRHRKMSEKVNFALSSFCAIRRVVFENIGGFDPAMKYYEDIDIGKRIAEKGYVCWLDKKIKVSHLKRYGHLTLLKDYFKKATFAGRHYRVNLFKKRNLENLPMLLKIAAISCVLSLFALFLLKINSIPFILMLSIYLAALFHFIIFLVRKHGVFFGLRAYLFCIEVFLVSFVAFTKGFLLKNYAK